MSASLTPEALDAEYADLPGLSPAMAEALAAIGRLRAPTVAEANDRLAAKMAAGQYPTLDAWNRPIPLDGDEAQRRREAIARQLQASSWETQAGEVEAVRAEMGRAS